MTMTMTTRTADAAREHIGHVGCEARCTIYWPAIRRQLDDASRGKPV
jgi:hypothetical protein